MFEYQILIHPSYHIATTEVLFSQEAKITFIQIILKVIQHLVARSLPDYASIIDTFNWR